MFDNRWLLCPICHNKTRVKINGNTILKNFPLYCPKCKNETLINAKRFNITARRTDAECITKQQDAEPIICRETSNCRLFLLPCCRSPPFGIEF